MIRVDEYFSTKITRSLGILVEMTVHPGMSGRPAVHTIGSVRRRPGGNDYEMTENHERSASDGWD